MGRTRTYVGTQIARVIEDGKLPSSVKKGVVHALFSNGNIVDNVLEEMVSNVGVRAERLYDWAAAGNYIHGLPSGQFRLPADSVLPAVKAVLDVVHGASVTMSYAHYGPPNSIHIGWMKLISDHLYNPVTNEIAYMTSLKGRPVYLNDMKLFVPAMGLQALELQSLEQWPPAARSGYTPERITGTPASRALILPTPPEAGFITNEVIRAEAIWLDETDTIQKEYFWIEPTGYDDAADYFHARYTVGGVVHYSMYRRGTGTYPTLDTLFDANPVVGGEFFPFIYFRYGKVSESAAPTSESYKDNAKMVKYLGMDYAQVADGVNANPDIADVEQAMMMFAVPANTTNEVEQKYLFQFFNNLFLAQGTSDRYQTEAQADVAASFIFGSDFHPPSIVIQDARFKMSLSNQGIYKIRKPGTVAPVKQYASGMSTFTVTTPFIHRNPDTEEETTYYKTTPVTYHTYQYQVTEGTYEEIQVVELQTRFHILGEYSTIGDDDDKILLIPLDHSITEIYSIPDREELYSRALHFVFNSVTVIKLRWYQTGIFAVILQIVAIVITFYTMGADGGSAITAAMALGNYALAAELIFTMVLRFILTKVAFTLFVKAVGAKTALVLAIVAVVAGLGSIIENGGLQGAPWAQELLSAATGLSNAASAQVQVDLDDLTKDLSEFQKYVEKQFKLLDSAQELLEHGVSLNPFWIFGEKPDDFYNRTVHSGNIGVVAIEAISSFVDSKLLLPTLDDSLGRGAQIGDWKL